MLCRHNFYLLRDSRINHFKEEADEKGQRASSEKDDNPEGSRVGGDGGGHPKMHFTHTLGGVIVFY